MNVNGDQNKHVHHQPFPVDGHWGVWGAWTECSKTCGVADKTRARICNNPSTAHGGKPCDGSNQDKNTCKENHCPGKRTGVWLLIFVHHFIH